MKQTRMAVSPNHLQSLVLQAAAMEEPQTGPTMHYSFFSIVENPIAYLKVTISEGVLLSVELVCNA